MNQRKKYSAYILIIMIALLTTACGPRFYKNRFNIGTSYKKWIKEIGIFSSKNINVWGYEEDENLITLDIIYDNGLDGYKELCDIINAHNKFVEENPDYFPENIRINIINTAGSQQIISTFNNFPSGYPELDRAGSIKIQCMSMRMESDNSVELSAGDEIQFDVPVVCLIFDDMPANSEYSFLNSFSKAEQVIIYFSDAENYSRETACEDIRKYLPNVEIYEKAYNAEEKEYHLQKIQ
ncbi:MAG: hypothetical protein J5504_07250 [Butyrivibrio sp.]|nr:hypothetical protein [Butyrivibrio sp.]